MAGWRWRGLGVTVSRCVVGCCALCRGSVEVRGVVPRWQRGGSAVWCGGCCAMLWGDVTGSCCAVLGWRAGDARRVRVAWGVSDGGALCAMLGQRGGGLAIEVLCAVLGQHGGLAVAGCWGRDRSGSCAQMACNVQGLAHRVGVARWVGSGGISGHDGGGSHARMACNVQGLACHVGAAQQVGGGSMLQAMPGQHVGAGTNGSGSRARGGGNGCNVQVERKKKKEKKNRNHIMLHWDKAQGLKGRVWRGRTRGGSGRTGRSKDCILVLGYVVSSGGLICGMGIPSPLCKIEDMAEDELAFGAMHKICHCCPLVHASHLGHLHSSPPQHAAPTWRTWLTSLASVQMHKICASFFSFFFPLTLNVASHYHCLEHASQLHLSLCQHATPTWLTTPRHRHPNIARNTLTTTPPQYGTQHPATANPTDPPCRLNAARKVQPPPTPTPP
ncbi:hypothetical protein EDB83DRAFT_2311989 [Lactarius deliciosus]|nr:hypothetical protein EDB83DRAFT_2311989 [Lactarius deliciosus]